MVFDCYFTNYVATNTNQSTCAYFNPRCARGYKEVTYTNEETPESLFVAKYKDVCLKE